MKKLFIVLLSGCLGLACSGPPEPHPVSAPQRIISLAPNLTETLFAVGAGDRVIAVSDFCKYPGPAGQLEKIGGVFNPNLERMVSLKPDLILGLPSHADLARTLSGYGLKTRLLKSDNLSEILAMIDSVGAITSQAGRSREITGQIRARLAETTIPARGSSAMLLIGREPGTVRALGVVGPGSFIDELWVLCGGRNIFTDLGSAYAQISQEALLARAPEIIIEFVGQPEQEGWQKIEPGQEWRDLMQLKKGWQPVFYTIPAGYGLTPGPRILRLADDFKTILSNQK